MKLYKHVYIFVSKVSQCYFIASQKQVRQTLLWIDNDFSLFVLAPRRGANLAVFDQCYKVPVQYFPSAFEERRRFQVWSNDNKSCKYEEGSSIPGRANKQDFKSLSLRNIEPLDLGGLGVIAQCQHCYVMGDIIL